MPLLGETATEKRRHLQLVFDDEDAHTHILAAEMRTR
jgi:hypothetical protein